MKLSRLAVMRPATDEVVAGWASTVEGLLLARADARRIGEREIALDAGEGRNVVVRFDEASLSFHGIVEDTAWYDEEHGTWEDDEDMNAPIDDLVWAVGRVICKTLRWGLHTERGVIPYVPSPCDACKTPVFDDEESCPGCERSLQDDEPDEAEALHSDEAAAEKHAERLVRALIEGGHLELASARSEPLVAQRVSRALLSELSAGKIADLLVELTPVSDLFCDDETLAKVVKATR